MNIFPIPRRTLALYNELSSVTVPGEDVALRVNRVEYPLLKLCVELERELEALKNPGGLKWPEINLPHLTFVPKERESVLRRPRIEDGEA